MVSLLLLASLLAGILAIYNISAVTDIPFLAGLYATADVHVDADVMRHCYR